MKSRSIALTIILSLAAVQMTIVGVCKILGVGPFIQQMASLHYPAAFARFIGACEVLGVIGLTQPRFRVPAILCFQVLTIGAIGSHLGAGQSVGQAAPAIVSLLLMSVALWLNSGAQLKTLLLPKQATATASVAAALMLTFGGFVMPTSAQEMPPRLATAPVQIASARTAVTFPAGTFLENIVIDPRGTLFVSSLQDGRIYRVAKDGTKQLFAQIKGSVGGLAFDGAGNTIAVGVSAAKTPAVFRITPQGVVETLLSLPNAQFLNGITPLGGDRFLIADSYLGAIWELDAAKRTAAIWLKDDLLGRSNPKNPLPGVNGLKIYQNALYASSTERSLLVKIPITAEGKPSSPTIFLDGVQIDDFAFGARGDLYATTHIHNSVVRISPQGAVTVIARMEQGMAGSTAAAFGRTAADSTVLYVTTEGGMLVPPPGGVQPAKVVALEVGKKGL